MDKILNALLDVNAKIRIINICESEFGDNNKYYQATKEGANEMIEDNEFTASEVYNSMYDMMFSEKPKDFISVEGNTFSFVDEDFINERFMIDIRQNIGHSEIKQIIIEELTVMNMSISELISNIEAI